MVRSICVFTKRFFSSFEDAMISKIMQEVRTEIYSVYMFLFYKITLANTALVD